MTGQARPPAEPRLLIVGLGLIGGSLAAALRAAGFDGEILACDPDAEEIRRGVDMGLIEGGGTRLTPLLEDVSLVVLAVPVLAMGEVMAELAAGAARAAPELVITDVGSTKGSVVDAAERALGDLPAGLVPGHPIAGTENSGVGAAFADLYRHRRVIITPLATSRVEAVETVRDMWQSCGAEVVEMGVVHHDEVLAATSHLPHMLAYTLVDSLARRDDSREIFDYAAGGFRDFTRIASSDPQMWHDICLANHAALIETLEQFSADLDALTEAVRNKDSKRLLEIFRHAKQRRDEFCQ